MEQSASGDCQNPHNGEYISRLLEQIATTSFFRQYFNGEDKGISLSRRTFH